MEHFIKRAFVEPIIILDSDDDDCIPDDGISRQNYIRGKTIRTQQQEMQEYSHENQGKSDRQ